MRKEPANNYDEQSYTTGWKKVMCVFSNHTGLGKKVKRAMNKRARRRGYSEIESQIRTEK